MSENMSNSGKTWNEPPVVTLSNNGAHYARCVACSLGQHPGGEHSWIEGWEEERELLTLCSSQKCGCECFDKPPAYDPTSESPDLDEDDLAMMSFDPCTVCGSTTGCATDAEGRTLIHVQEYNDGE